LSWLSRAAPWRALVVALRLRVLLKLALSEGSKLPKARRMALRGVSSVRRWIWISVLLAITSSR
jgi:hypothetical protein